MERDGEGLRERDGEPDGESARGAGLRFASGERESARLASLAFASSRLDEDDLDGRARFARVHSTPVLALRPGNRSLDPLP